MIKGRLYKKGVISEDNIDWFVKVTNIWAHYNIDIDINTEVINRQFIFTEYIFFSVIKNIIASFFHPKYMI